MHGSSLASWLAASLALLSLGLALASHSPQDLYAYPRFDIELSQSRVLNDSLLDLLKDYPEVRKPLTASAPELALRRRT